ncbi:MAG: DUF916 domain-containing protein [Actinomycetia bacterium]|nr:DUF916 domain-containing protein [Actinomycetes bacterium]
MNLRVKPVSAVLAMLLLSGAMIAPFAYAEDAAPPTTEPTPAPTPTDDTAVPPENVIVESFSIGPTGSLDPSQPGDRVNFSYDAAPGVVIHDSVTVYNVGNVALPFHVYSTDGFNQTDGTFDLLTGDELPTDVGSWVTFDAQDLTIPAGKQALIPITITVPADASPGDHVGGIVASSPIEGKNDTGQIITVDRRVGAKLYIRVTGTLHAELAVTQLNGDYSHALNPLGGGAKVSFRIENRGDVRLGGSPVVTVSGPFGFGEQSIDLPPLVDLLPGETADLSVDFDDVGAWFIDSVSVEITAVGATENESVDPVRGESSMFAPPITLLVVLALLVALWLWLRSRRQRRADAQSDGDQSNEPENALSRS